MNETLNWHDLQLFLAVAQAGGLAGATNITGLSAPTLGRRMTSLEQTAGCDLFIRHQNGYELTPEAKQLLTHVHGMQEASTGVSRWQEQRTKQSIIKITAGAWTCRFISQNVREFPIATTIRLMSDNNFLDLRRREAHLAIRNQRPTQQGLAVRKLERLEFAIYGTPEFAQTAEPLNADERLFKVCPWIVYEPVGSAAIPSSAWLSARLSKPPTLVCSTPTLVLDAALAGVGLCVLPCFVGAAEPKLKRLSETIPELSHVQWLVSHDEDRHLKHVRQASKALHKLFALNKAFFAGDAS